MYNQVPEVQHYTICQSMIRTCLVTYPVFLPPSPSKIIYVNALALGPFISREHGNITVLEASVRET